MKRFAIFFLLLALLLSACGTTGQPAATEAPAVTFAPSAEPRPSALPEEPASPEAPSTPATPVSDEVWPALDLSGDYRDSVGNSYHYSYQIPEFAADSEDAARLNEALYSKLYAEVEDELYNMEKGYSLMLIDISYTFSRCDDILSVVVLETLDFEFPTYYVMNLDVSTGLEADRAALLAHEGLSEADFMLLAPELAEAAFRSQYSSLSDEDFCSMGGEELLAKTSDPANFGPGLPLFLNEEGRLCMVAPIYSFAGAEYYYEVIVF